MYLTVDLVYHRNQGGLEYDFFVAPWTDPRKITLGFAGPRKLDVDAEGDYDPWVYAHAVGADDRRFAEQIGELLSGANSPMQLPVAPKLSSTLLIGCGGWI